MALLNYTTGIPVERTLQEIEGLLVNAGAAKVLKDYDGDKNIVAVSFMIHTERGDLPFRLPMNVRAVMQVINNETEQFKVRRHSRSRVVPKKFKNDLQQARMVGWRILKDWLEAQLALLELQMVKVQEIFLPYIVSADGKTLYEVLEGKGFKGFLLDAPKEVE